MRHAIHDNKKAHQCTIKIRYVRLIFCVKSIDSCSNWPKVRRLCGQVYYRVKADENSQQSKLPCLYDMYFTIQTTIEVLRIFGVLSYDIFFLTASSGGFEKTEGAVEAAVIVKLVSPLAPDLTLRSNRPYQREKVW